MTALFLLISTVLAITCAQYSEYYGGVGLYGGGYPVYGGYGGYPGGYPGFGGGNSGYGYYPQQYNYGYGYDSYAYNTGYFNNGYGYNNHGYNNFRCYGLIHCLRVNRHRRILARLGYPTRK